uniref:hypothetical protein n=1 Tax=Timspurckia oligopyrenoides TaxID=708627 RepID=UPI001FCE28D4|nr:hypothetical protein MW591_pgp001 [Timspurckia oligopyrenoides]UNJ17614.1 hypothetical protein [Timspurckia oligopyrenoides]
MLQYKSYVYKPASWLHLIQPSNKLKLIIYTYLFLLVGKSCDVCVVIYLLFLSIAKTRYKCKYFYYNILGLGGLVIYLCVLILCTIKIKLQVLPALKMIFITCRMLTILVINRTLGYTTHIEELSLLVSSINRIIPNIALAVKLSGEFLCFITSKSHALLYIIATRDIDLNVKHKNHFNFILFKLTAYLFLELYSQVNRFTLLLYLSNRYNSGLIANRFSTNRPNLKQGNHFTMSLLMYICMTNLL